ncbi:MAG: formamidopyrimidine-DNA glycosylase [Acidimicrobiia bacterium]|nr:formamidopyrimidine-DNA glycosylase [Acidimicrobiia bacterium]MYG59089.1 formamidopyrimidine-DNA glycosylase [Acidimicrobiia bacterium]MYJ33223.1 formamidopyrimidine-DNA glycosylase [Acidimicrobiia bacterium]
MGRSVSAVHAPDDWFIKGGADAQALSLAFTGQTVVGLRRTGKLLMMDFGDPDSPPGAVLGLRFGMTGRLVVDDHAVIEKLEYSSARVLPEWRCFELRFDDEGTLVVVDPRRLGGVELNPDDSRLGPDAFELTAEQLAAALEGSRTALKARLLDQHRVAGLGNLLVDEILWRTGLDPAREADSLDRTEHEHLAEAIRTTVAQLAERGGSHTGDLHLARVRGGSCPRDGELLDRRTIGGRTTYSCPQHQR